MRRIPEPELMDAEEQARAYAAADFSEPNSLFVDTFRRCFSDLSEGTVLDLGCGPADICIRLARAYPDCKVVGVDGAEAMLRLGRLAVRREKLQARVELILWRMGQHRAAAELRGADAIASNSLLHHLDEPGVLWRTIQDCATPGAGVLVMDLIRPASSTAARQLVAEYSAREPEILQQDFFNSLLAAYRVDEVQAQLEQVGLSHLETEVISDRHFIVFGRL